MAITLTLLKFAAKATLNVMSGGIGVDFAVEVLPEIAAKIWKLWKERTEEERREDVKALAQAPPAEIQDQVKEIIAEEAGKESMDQQLVLEGFLNDMTSAVRDATTTKKAEDVLRLLPRSNRYFLIGLPVTAVIRWMGSKNWTKEEATRCVRSYGVNCANGTITTQWNTGRRGVKIPHITDEQAQELEQARWPTEGTDAVPTDSEAAQCPTRGQRYFIWEHSLCGVLRWMGKQEWSKEDATKVIEHFGIDCSPAIIPIQVRAGLKGERGAPAELTKEQVSELNAIAGRPVNL